MIRDLAGFSGFLFRYVRAACSLIAARLATNCSPVGKPDSVAGAAEYWRVEVREVARSVRTSWRVCERCMMVESQSWFATFDHLGDLLPVANQYLLHVNIIKSNVLN